MINKSWSSNLLYQILFIFLISMIFCGNLLADNHYVSPTGSATWAMSISISTPCSASTAMNNAVAGDTVYFRGGIYYVGQSVAGPPTSFQLKPSHNGTAGNPIKFQAYPGETPVIDATVTSPSNSNSVAIGAVGSPGSPRTYIIFDGFIIRGNGGTAMAQAYFYYADNCTLKNCNLTGGGNPLSTSENLNCVRSQYTNYFTMQNCIIHDVNGGSNYNVDGIEFYYSYHATIVNNEFYNNSCALYLKNDTADTLIANNYFHNNVQAIGWHTFSGPRNVDRLTIHDNVIINSSFGAISGDAQEPTAHMDDFLCYNNTIYNTARGINIGNSQSGHGAKIYNNIIQITTSEKLLVHGDNGTLALVAGEDHNQWGTGSGYWKMSYGNSMRTYTTLANWQASNELAASIDLGCGPSKNPGCHDFASDPRFINTSGNLNKLEDFTLQSSSPCKGAGRNGVDMGANIDNVGVNPALLPTAPPTDTNPPASPSGVNVIIIQ